MSLRLSLSPQRGSKTQNGHFPCIIALRLKKVCYKVSLCENCQRQSCIRYWPNYPCNNDWWGTSPSMRKFGGWWPTRLQCADFRSIFARSASAVTRSEKSSINTNRKSTTRFPVSLRWKRTLSLSPQRVAQKQLSTIWTISCDNSETYEIGCQLVLITNKKSHTGFRLILSSMTLNDLEWRNNPYFAFSSPNSIALLANYVIVVENRPIMSADYCLPVPVFHVLPKLTHPAARSLCDSWATCLLS